MLLVLNCLLSVALDRLLLLWRIFVWAQQNNFLLSVWIDSTHCLIPKAINRG